MKRSSLLKAVLAFLLFTCCTSSFGQPGTNVELNSELTRLRNLILDLKDQVRRIDAYKESLTSSLELVNDERSGALTVYTKPVRCKYAPEIQMIALQSSEGSGILYQIRIELFSREGSIHLNKVHIKSVSNNYEYKLKKNTFSKDSEYDGILLSRCWGSGCKAGLEGFTYTFQITVSEEDFFNIISSGNIKVGFSSALIPEKEISNDDRCKMNELFAFLMAERSIEMVNLQLEDAISKFQEIQKLLNYI